MALKISSTYVAPRWLPGGHTQTIYAYTCAKAPRVETRRESWRTPDDDVIVVDCLDGPNTAPLLLLFHGLEGGGHSPYARSMFGAAQAAGWRMMLPHFRGCGGVANLLPRAYHSGDSAEANWILRRARDIAGDAPMYAAGVSLGGNVLLKWLGEEGENAAQLIRAAVAVSAPLDLNAAGNALGRGFNMVYTRMFLATLIRKSMDKLERHPGIYEAERVQRARTLREFDDVVTAPLHGFIDAEDYWTRSSSKPLLNTIRIPTLILNALNDPFLPASVLPREAEASNCVRLEYPETGGHVGFVSGTFRGHLQWLPNRIIDFLTQADSL
ncbi:MAG TPA: alpha/beta fold hydrolase [Burkholderiales bacterium]|nr:alpha/beta fold hydrolase [Burkholderiales bacterium]